MLYGWMDGWTARWPEAPMDDKWRDRLTDWHSNILSHTLIDCMIV